MFCIKRLNLFHLNLCIDFNNNFHKSAHTIDVAAAVAADVNRDATQTNENGHMGTTSCPIRNYLSALCFIGIVLASQRYNLCTDSTPPRKQWRQRRPRHSVANERARAPRFYWFTHDLYKIWGQSNTETEFLVAFLFAYFTILLLFIHEKPQIGKFIL